MSGRSRSPRLSISVLSGALILALAAGDGLLASCRPASTGPISVLASGSGETRSLAAGPFAGLRWLGSVGDMAWGWGDLSDGRQVFFTVETDGSLAVTEIPGGGQLDSVAAVAGGLGMVALRSPRESGGDQTGWYYPLTGDPVSFGKADALRVSPLGSRLLALTADAVTCVELPSLRTTVQPPLPSYELPPTGTNVTWIDDSLVAVRYGEPGGGPEGLSRDTCTLRLFSEPDGTELATLWSDGDILSPFPSPDGKWLAVLHVDGDEFDLEAGNIIPPDIGREVRLYSRDSLGGSDPQPAAVLKPPAGQWLLGLEWAPGGSKLAYLEMEANASGDTGRDSTVIVTAPPEWNLLDLGLGLASWSPGPFSPDGSKLFVFRWSDEGFGSVIHDFATNTDARLEEKLMVFHWVGNDRMVAFPSGYETGVPQIIDTATGQIAPSPWPAASVSWLEALDGSHAVLKVVAASAADLAGFSGAQAGEWLVVGSFGAEP